MSESREAREGHPAGDGPSAVREVAREAVKVDTFGGTVHVEWDPDAAATPLGHLAFFAEYLKVSGRFDALVADCPLNYTSPNAAKRDVLGTVLLSALAGQSALRTSRQLRGDRVYPSLLGMSKVASEDSVRRDAWSGSRRRTAHRGCTAHLDDTVRSLLSEPWVLDCDTTIKPLYAMRRGRL